MPPAVVVVDVAVVGVAVIMVVVGVGMLICSGSSGCGVDESGCFLGADSWCSTRVSRSRSCRYLPGVRS